MYQKNFNFCPYTKYCNLATTIDSCLFSKTLNTLNSFRKFLVSYTLIECAAAVLLFLSQEKLQWAP